ncbi:hypothetical protein GCM10010124_09580 [Pilimelia terevasa]|uniref:AMP-dependent synthetase/ligase domain-containing protein n=1 Tax=Pilimelia terevasa TaxID=53372 RepID=A0A8J3FFQ6_9ACTN|nr:AMP-binding protein [Pilimelia terevasa]GGK19050.1 hypothetical protein GCM10010124_09580 [Pilimelia terevasa]
MTSSDDARLRAVFSATAARTPDAIAVACEDRYVTFAELADLTDRFARRLRQHGVRRGDVVAVHLTRSELPVIAVLACHSLAVTYVPIDPGCPVERIAQIIDELGVGWCVTEPALGGRVAPLLAARRTIAIRHDSAFFTVGVRSDHRGPIDDAEPDDPAYVTYTRDAGGAPKAVVAEHRHVAAYLAGFREICPVGPGDRVYQGHALSFDGSIAEIWSALAGGATLVVPAPDAPRTGAALTDHLADLRITHLATTPETLADLDPAALPELRAVVLSGGACPPELVARWSGDGVVLLNVYGPAETTVHALVKRCAPGAPVTLGRALPGYEVSVVDAGLHPVRDGHTGELLLGGPALAAGYVGDPELTRERFVTLDGGRRAFRTGDRVRQVGDELEYRGRQPAPAAPHPPRQRGDGPPPVPPAGPPSGRAPVPGRPAAAESGGRPARTAPPEPTPPVRPPAPRTAREVFRDTSADARATSRRRQLLGLYLVAAMVAVPAALVVTAAAAWVTGGTGPAGLLGRLLLVAVLAWPALLGVTLAAKWLLIGRYAEGEYPLWGEFHRRWWLVGRLYALSGVGLLAGTPALPVYLRLLGARIGERVHLETVAFGAFDLLRIGADSSVGPGADLRGWAVADGVLRVGRIAVGDRCFVGARAALGPDVVLGDDCALDDQSALAADSQIPAGAQRRGAPAVPARVPLPAPAAPASRHRQLGYGVAHVLGAYLVIFLAALPPLLALLLYGALAERLGGWSAAGAVVAALPVLTPFSVLLLAVARRRLLGEFYVGTYPVHSPAYLRKWLADQLLRVVRVPLTPVFGTAFTRPVLSLFGAQIGPGAEVERPHLVSPEALNVAADAHLAADAVVAPRRVHRGAFTVAASRIGRRGEVGDGAVVRGGVSVGDDSTLAPGTLAPDDSQRSAAGSRWAGSPAAPVGRRPAPRAQRYRPSRRERAERLLYDAARVLVPYGLALLGAVLFAYPTYLLWSALGAWAAVPVAPLLGLAAGAAVVAAVAALKRLVLGRVRALPRAAWSPYARLYGVVSAAYDTLAAPLLSALVGTPFLAGPLRAFGVRVGPHAYLGTTRIAGFDLVRIGAFAALGADAVVKADLRTGQRFLTGTVTVADEASVGQGAVLLPDSAVGAAAGLAPLAVLPAGAILPPGERAHGIPCRLIPAALPAARPPRRDAAAGRGAGDPRPDDDGDAAAGWLAAGPVGTGARIRRA